MKKKKIPVVRVYGIELTTSEDAELVMSSLGVAYKNVTHPKGIVDDHAKLTYLVCAKKKKFKKVRKAWDMAYVNYERMV